MARLAQIVVDAASPPSLARFWAAALEDFEVRPYDEAEIERLASLGFTPETDPTVLVDGPTLEICFQKIDTVPTQKQRVHLDLVAEDRQIEVERLINLGAQVHEEFSDHTWLIDPEGNDFCITDR
jgi:hypothetical protein